MLRRLTLLTVLVLVLAACSGSTQDGTAPTVENTPLSIPTPGAPTTPKTTTTADTDASPGGTAAPSQPLTGELCADISSGISAGLGDEYVAEFPDDPEDTSASQQKIMELGFPLPSGMCSFSVSPAQDEGFNSSSFIALTFDTIDEVSRATGLLANLTVPNLPEMRTVPGSPTPLPKVFEISSVNLEPGLGVIATTYTYDMGEGFQAASAGLVIMFAGMMAEGDPDVDLEEVYAEALKMYNAPFEEFANTIAEDDPDYAEFVRRLHGNSITQYGAVMIINGDLNAVVFDTGGSAGGVAPEVEDDGLAMMRAEVDKHNDLIRRVGIGVATALSR